MTKLKNAIITGAGGCGVQRMLYIRGIKARVEKDSMAKNDK